MIWDNTVDYPIELYDFTSHMDGIKILTIPPLNYVLTMTTLYHFLYILLGAASWTMRYGPAEKRLNPTPPILTSRGKKLFCALVLVLEQGATLSFRVLLRYLSCLLLDFNLSFWWLFLSLHFYSYISWLFSSEIYSTQYCTLLYTYSCTHLLLLYCQVWTPVIAHPAYELVRSCAMLL
jgi:hypothetical protein